MMSETTAPRTYKDFAQPIVRRLLLNRESAIIALLIVVLIGASLIVPGFASAATAT